MAITNNDMKLLFYGKKLGVRYDNTLMLGRLSFYGTEAYLKKLIDEYKNTEKQLSEISFADPYSEPLFKLLGAETVDSLDFSNYENATIIHDLNTPVKVSMHEKFTAIVDGGTIEHVFNFPVAIGNCMNMLKKGGHYIGITPANNLMGHGFYQFSPELYFRVFSEINGFEVLKMLITATDESGNFNTWYEVADPEKVHNRVVLQNDLPTYIMCIARRKEVKPLFSVIPQQSDYSYVWSAGKKNGDGGAKQPFLKKIYKSVIPFKVRTVLSAVYSAVKKSPGESKDLGAFDKNHFKEFKDNSS